MTTDRLTIIREDSPQETEEPAAAPRPIWLAPLAALTVLAAATWITLFAVASGSGLDITDEGFYLLSYRWWDVNPRTFSAAQYFYGPVFEMLGYNIAWLRLFRLLTIVVTLVAFGWTFMRWLRQRRPNAPASRLWEVAGTAAIVAGGAATVSWLPLSPGYNDVSLLTGFVAATTVVASAGRVSRAKPVPPWIPGILGAVGAAALLVKWTSTLAILGAVAIAAVVVLLPLGWRGIAKFAGWALLAAVVMLAAIHLLIVPLDKAVPQILEVNRLAALSGNSPSLLFTLYWDTSVTAAKQIVRSHKVLLAATVLAVMLRGRRWEWIGTLAVVVGLAWSARRVYLDGLLVGGANNLTRYPMILMALALVSVLIGAGTLLRRRWGREGSLGSEGRAGWAILVLLLVLPVAQALGTGNWLYFMAVNAFAAWMALIVAVLTGVERSVLNVRGLAAAVAASAVAASVIIGSTAVAEHPYRTTSYAESTASAGVPALSSVRLDPENARAYGELYQVLKPYIEPEGRAVMAFDEMAGIVLLLGGRPVGEAWYSDLDPSRTAKGIQATCAGGNPWWGERAPILIFKHEVRALETEALKSCDLDFETGYRLLTRVDKPMKLAIYIPAADAAKGQQ